MASPSAVVQALRARRIALGLSQRDIANATGLSRIGIGQAERGQASPTLRVLEAYAAAVGTTITVAEPASIDPVHVERACAGQFPWSRLTDEERLTVYTTLTHRGWSKTRISRHFNLSGATVNALERGEAQPPEQRAA